MRTYSRNPPEHKELENVMDLCRLCLEKADERVPIFSDDFNEYSSLSVRIMNCIGLEMTKEEYVPNIICAQCHKDLEQCYLFRKKCTNSYQKLKSHIQAVKAKVNKCKDTPNARSIDGSSLLRERNNGFSENVIGNAVLKTEIITSVTDTTNLLNKIRDQSHCVKQPSGPTSSSKELLQPEETVPDPEISTFLCTILTELGLLTRHADGIVDLSPEISNLEVESRDGNNIVFEFVEEEEEVENDSEECPKEKKIRKENDEAFSISEDSRSVSGSKFKCDECGRVLTSRSALARHKRAVHARLRPYACPLCDMKFAQKGVMARHKLVHQEKRPFQCNKCPKSFTQRSALEAHARYHRPWEGRPLTLHQCPYCPKVFLYTSGLSRHLLLHSNTRFSCRRCGRRFADCSSRRRHEKTNRCANTAHCAREQDAATAAAAAAAHLSARTETDSPVQ